MKNLVLSSVCWISFVSFGATPLVFKDRGNQINSLDLAALSKISSPTTLTVFEHHEDRKVSYRVLDFTKLLNQIYGDKWKQREEILFTCADGFQPSIPREQFEKAQAFLAFERIGARKFTINNKAQRENNVGLGPFYLIWKGKTATREYWPYQIIAVDLITFSERFPKMAPPSTATDAEIRGFSEFRMQCQPCHTINGQGGSKGVELNYPISVVEYFQPKALRQWIIDPAVFRYNTSMPAFDREDPKWQGKLDDILAYLNVMAKNPRKPE